MAQKKTGREQLAHGPTLASEPAGTSVWISEEAAVEYLGVIEAQQEGDDRRFSSARGTHQRDFAARRNGEVYAPQHAHVRARGVREPGDEVYTLAEALQGGKFKRSTRVSGHER